MTTKVTVTTQLGTRETVAGYLYPSHRPGVFTYTPDYLADPTSSPSTFTSTHHEPGDTST